MRLRAAFPWSARKEPGSPLVVGRVLFFWGQAAGWGGWSGGSSNDAGARVPAARSQGQPPARPVPGRQRDDQRCPDWTRGVPAAPWRRTDRQPVTGWSPCGEIRTGTWFPCSSCAPGSSAAMCQGGQHSRGSAVGGHPDKPEGLSGWGVEGLLSGGVGVLDGLVDAAAVGDLVADLRRPGRARFSICPMSMFWAVGRGPCSFTVVVEIVLFLMGWSGCSVPFSGHGRRQVLLHDVSRAGVPVLARAGGCHKCRAHR